MIHRDKLLLETDQNLLQQCEVRPYQGSGPGGQHRNRTYTGVELRIPQFNVEIRCCDDRSALINRQHALHGIRLKLALAIRQEPPAVAPDFPGSKGRINPNNTAFAHFIALSFDVLVANQAQIAPSAQFWNLSSSALLRIFSLQKPIWTALTQIRTQFALPPLKHP